MDLEEPCPLELSLLLIAQGTTKWWTETSENLEQKYSNNLYIIRCEKLKTLTNICFDPGLNLNLLAFNQDNRDNFIEDKDIQPLSQGS